MCVSPSLPSFMDKVKLHLMKVAEAAKQPPGPDTPTITHALLETYSRLLIWLGTRNFQSELSWTLGNWR